MFSLEPPHFDNSNDNTHHNLFHGKQIIPADLVPLSPLSGSGTNLQKVLIR